MFDRVMGIFDYRHSFYEFMKKIGWVFLINILFILTSLPIITIGASTTAMYTILQKLIKEREFSLLKDYFSSFKRNFKKATLMWIVILPICLVCYFDLMFFVAMLDSFGVVGIVMLTIAIIVSVVVLMYVLIVFPILAEFEGSIKDTLTVTMFVVKKNILKCLMAVGYTAIIIGFTLYIIIYAEYIFIYFPLLAFAFNGFVLSYIYDSILRPYYEEDEELEEYSVEEE